MELSNRKNGERGLIFKNIVIKLLTPIDERVLAIEQRKKGYEDKFEEMPFMIFHAKRLGV